MSPLTQWSPDDWEEYVNDLLRLRYGPTDYQRVPATDRGDCGIEGFSISDRAAYQSYAAQEYATNNQLYEKQRAKMTADIGKFIRNRAKLQGLFGDVRIRRWVLAVPEFETRRLVAHASDKTTEVRRALLPYVDPTDFRVMVTTAQDFAAEHRQLATMGAVAVDVAPVHVDPATLSAFTADEGNSHLLGNLLSKLQNIPSCRDERVRVALVDELCRGYLVGQAYIGQLADQYPQLHRQVLALKQQKESVLTVRSLVTSQAANERMDDLMEELRVDLERSVPSLAPMYGDLIKESLADWLMRCPLDFVATA